MARSGIGQNKDIFAEFAPKLTRKLRVDPERESFVTMSKSEDPEILLRTDPLVQPPRPAILRVWMKTQISVLPFLEIALLAVLLLIRAVTD
ncbi:hypothetical protein [Roseovarius aestuariivivens]|uniref:hypothetical protein n=1 Tax=Roseovarius aestuariivivens TaxID=1888910 RepID=UPI001436BFD8|nr:hypothetical protein [Roseovarius aestuariivivens]